MEDKSGIPEILEAEIEELQKELLAIKEKKVTSENILEELTVGFFLSSEKPMVISGVALAEGIWKNTIYPAEELKKACKDLIGKPVKVEHGKDKEFGDRAVGKVIQALWDEILKAIKFKAEITDPKAIEYIKNERFKAVSMSTWMEKVPVGVEGVRLGHSFKFAELSLVENPACERCFIFHFEQLSKIEGKMEKDLKVEEKKGIVGEKMTEELAEEPVILALIEEGEFLEEVELSSEAELEELRKTKKVVGYYYGYPYYGYPYGKKGKKKVYRRFKKKASEEEEEHEPNALAVFETNDRIEILELDTTEELMTEIENAKKAGKKIVAYYYGCPYYGHYYGQYYPYGKYYPYYGYPYGYRHFKYPRRKKLSEEEIELPFEEMEDKIKCRACGKEFTNYKDFIAHWVKEHRAKYGPYKPVGYPEYKKPETKGEDELAEKYKIVFNKKTKKYTVFIVPEKGLWKIVGAFDSKAEAQKFIEGKEKEEESKKSLNPKCPVCGKTFNTFDEFKVHWAKEHQMQYGEYKPAPEAKAKEDNSLPPVQPDVEKKEVDLMEEKKTPEPASEKKVEEAPKEQPKVEAPKEEPKEAPKEEPKVEVAKEVKVEEAPKVEVKAEEKKEEPKVEAPKVEEPKPVEKPVEEEPKLTVEEIMKIIKESPEAKKIILEKWFESQKSGRR